MASMSKHVYEAIKWSDTLIDVSTWFQLKVASPFRHSRLGAYMLPAWTRKSVRIPQTQPFLRDWLTANGIDPIYVSDDIALRYAKWYDRLGCLTAKGAAIVVHPWCPEGAKSVAIVGNKPFNGAMIYPLKVWPEGVERVPEWDANTVHVSGKH